MPAGRKVRRLGVLVAVGAVLAMVVAPADAKRSGTHFDVVGEVIRQGETDGQFRFREALFNPLNLNNRVGWMKGRCRLANKTRCRAVFHFDGSIGGFGDLWVRGNFGGGDSTGNVVDGTGTFTGAVTGKVNIDFVDRNTSVYRFHITH
jgi:hypothetical protein